MAERPADHEDLRERFVACRGDIPPVWEDVLRLDPDFFDAQLALFEAPARSAALSPKVRELLGVAINASSTHLYAPGVREHIQRALRHGATRDEVMEVFQIISVIGIHSCALGVPILFEELTNAGLPAELPELSPRQQEIKREFTDQRGYWAPPWEAVLALDPDFFAAYFALSGAPWRGGVLPPKVKEFVYIAHSASVTNFHQEGLRAHIGIALRFGATQREIMEVFEVVTALSSESLTFGVPILIEECEKAASRG
jgi:alkylhydroperoxidase/carboxymuconolactone decarboxylase family protein YurZ